MLRGLFQHKKNVLVEGMSDYYYLHALSQQCRAKGREALPDDVYITPCGGTKMVGNIAALFLGQDVRPLILLDADDAGTVRRNALLKELYLGHDSHIVMLDEVLGRPGLTTAVEDILGETIVLPAVNASLPKALALNADDRKTPSLPDQIKAAAQRNGIDLPDGWKPDAALRLVSAWATQGIELPDDVLASASKLFAALNTGFANAVPAAKVA
jgi:hypothetical protein